MCLTSLRSPHTDPGKIRERHEDILEQLWPGIVPFLLFPQGVPPESTCRVT